MPRKVAVVVSSPESDKICCFCGLKDENELEYGQFHEYDGIVTHYYCLLLSSNMQQRGRDDEGILGFLTEDINKELRRGKRLACCYCKKSGATLGCCNTKCKRIFHFPCGLKSGSLHQFFGEFKSYCRSHRPTQKIDNHVSQEVKDVDTMICYICYDEVNRRDMLGTLWAPCCKKNAWFHRICIQQLARSAGYFFKCPLCNNKTEFQKAMLDHGIFIPSQDASWELVPNAFEELLYRHNRCDAHKCLCPKGREHVSTNAKWELTLCRTCGSQGIHMACGRLKWVKPIWECTECTSILNKSVTSGNGDMSSLVRSCREHRSPRDDGDLLTDDESSSDSDISVGGVSDMHVPIPIDSPLKSELSPINFHKLNDTQKNLEEIGIATLSGGRNTLARSMFPTENLASHEFTHNLQTDDELPPVPKKPRITDTFVLVKEPEPVDSDDDIIVISGPSRREKGIVPTNGEQSPVHQFERFFVDCRSAEEDKRAELQSSTNLRQPDTRKIEKLETPSKFSLDASTEAEIRVIKRPSSETLRPPPVEIDLSDGEITVPKSLSTFETKRTVNSFDDGPELNIKISNVTSLPPGAFDLVPEMTNGQSDATSNFNISNGGLTSEDPIILDEFSTTKASDNNNMDYDSPHDQLKIIRFDGPDIYASSQGNSVIYGLTIPGTNHTVPLIVEPPENCKSETPGIHSDPSNPLGVALCDCNSSRAPTFTDILNLNVCIDELMKNCATNSSTAGATTSPNVTRKVENSQSASLTAISTKQSLERSTAPQSIDPKLWSVPLKSIVHGTIMKTHSSAKSSINTVNDSTFIDNYASFVKINGSSVAPRKTVTLPAKTIVPNKIECSATSIIRANTITPPKPAPLAQANDPNPNEIVSKLFALLPQASLPASQATTTPPNGLISSAKSKNSKILPKSNMAICVPEASAVWAKINGSYIPIEPATAKEMLNATNTPESTQLQIQQSSTSDSTPPILRFINVDQNDSNDSSRNCDGDAGSAPAVQPTPVSPTNAKLDRPRTTATISRRLGPAFHDRERIDADRTNERRCDYLNDDTAECPVTPDGDYACNRTGLINKTINLRDIKFTIGGPNIVKMTLYETYNVNIKVDTTSRCKYEISNDVSDSASSTLGITNRSSLTPGENISSVTNCDSEETAVSLMNDCSNFTVDSHDDTEVNQSEGTSENNVATPESVTTRVQMDTGSRGQDELKENRDPIPPSTNSTDATSIVDRKSKPRWRVGVNDHSMRSLNEKTAQEKITEKIDTSPSKFVANEVYYNGCKNTNETRPLVASVETDVNNSVVARSSINGSCNYEITEQLEAAKRQRKSAKDGNSGETRDCARPKSTDESNNYNCTKMKSLESNVSPGEIMQQFDPAKRRRMSTKDGNSNTTRDFPKLMTNNDSKNHNKAKIISLVNNVEKYKRKWSVTTHVCRSEKFHVNNILHNGETTGSNESLCCKVSIDLTRIREVLTTKLNVPEDVKFDKRNDELLVNKINGRNARDSKSFLKWKTVLSRSRSSEHLAGHDRSRVDRASIVELRRSRSFDSLDSLSLQYHYANGITGGNRKRSFKRKTRNFEKHGCVR